MRQGSAGSGIVAVAAALAGLVLLAGMPALAAPPIFQPGAPGETGRTITAEESVALGRSRYVEADVRFMQHMIVHHGQAVDMGALIADRTSNRTIRLLGQRIALSQEAEIAMMRTWLTRRGEATAMPGHHGDHAMVSHGGAPSDVPLMPGMLSPAQMAELAAADGAEFDRRFLTGMIAHHQGAIDMVEALLAEPGAGEDPEISEFLNAVVADQTIEIARMRAMLAGIG